MPTQYVSRVSTEMISPTYFFVRWHPICSIGLVLEQSSRSKPDAGSSLHRVLRDLSQEGGGMSTVHHLQDTNGRSVRARKHDSSKAKGTLPERSVCRESLAVCHTGRWTWDPSIGRTVLTSPKKQILFSQGEAADAVFYIQAGLVQLTAVSQQGKEAVLAMLEEGAFCGNPAWPDKQFVPQPRAPRKTLVSCASTKMP